MGTGPYFMPEGGWVRGESLTLKRNPNWWRHKEQGGSWNRRLVFFGRPSSSKSKSSGGRYAGWNVGMRWLHMVLTPCRKGTLRSGTG